MVQQATHQFTQGKHSITLHPHFIVEFAEYADDGQHALDGAGVVSGGRVPSKKWVGALRSRCPNQNNASETILTRVRSAPWRQGRRRNLCPRALQLGEIRICGRAHSLGKDTATVIHPHPIKLITSIHALDCAWLSSSITKYEPADPEPDSKSLPASLRTLHTTHPHSASGRSRGTHAVNEGRS